MLEMIERPTTAAADWVEVLAQQMDRDLVSGLRQIAPATVEHRIGDGQSLHAWHPPCRCWRCRGGVASADRSSLDRLLGLHLSRIPTSERDDFLRGWSANPRHDKAGRANLEAWIRIACGSREEEPSYPKVPA